jgi:hypothetical protein
VCEGGGCDQSGARFPSCELGGCLQEGAEYPACGGVLQVLASGRKISSGSFVETATTPLGCRFKIKKLSQFKIFEIGEDCASVSKHDGKRVIAMYKDESEIAIPDEIPDDGLKYQGEFRVDFHIINGECNQRGARFPSCNGGKCLQDGATSATCNGGECLHEGAERATCGGGNCVECSESMGHRHFNLEFNDADEW